MNNKIRLGSIFLGLLSSISTYACSKIESSSERLNCQKAVEDESKSNMQKSYSGLYEYLSYVEGYQKQIVLSQKLWSKSAHKNCDVYSYFVEESTIVYDITFSECMTEEYKNRDKFIIHLRSVVEQFY